LIQFSGPALTAGYVYGLTNDGWTPCLIASYKFGSMRTAQPDPMPVSGLHSPAGCKSHTWEECRRCGGLAEAEARTCKRALRWRPAAGQQRRPIHVAFSGQSVADSAASPF